MGDCKYCGRDAGWLRQQHNECDDRHWAGRRQMVEICADAALSGTGYDTLSARLSAIRANGFIKGGSDRRAIVEGWCRAFEQVLDDHLLSDAELAALNRYRRHFGLLPHELNRQGHYTELRQALLLKMVQEKGTVPPVDRNDNAWGVRPPFNLMKSEALVWLFPNTDYYTEVTRREYQGGSTGVSFRVMSGVYLRQSAFKGRPVEKTSMEKQGTGLMGITTKHIYFAAGFRSFRVRLDRIVSFEPYSDGVGIMRDTQRAKPEIFRNDAGWFTMNLLDALAMAGITASDPATPPVDDLIEDEGLMVAFFGGDGGF